MLTVTGKGDQKFDVIALTDIKNMYYSLVIDNSYLSEQLAFAMLFLGREIFLAMQTARQSRVGCVGLHSTSPWRGLLLCSKRDYTALRRPMALLL